MRVSRDTQRLLLNPWANLTPRDPPLQPTCSHARTCVAFLVAPICKCGGELINPCNVPIDGETRACFMNCGGRYTHRRGLWAPASALPYQRPPPRVQVRPVLTRVK